MTRALILLLAALLATPFAMRPGAAPPAPPPVDPPAALAATPMCAADEPGEPLEITGRVVDERGKGIPKASIIAYSTDASGIYVPSAARTRTPRINAVAVTDADGWYRFRTIRPGPYPDSDDPSHVHLHIDAAVRKHTYRTLWFEGDPRLTPAKRRAIDAETRIVPVRQDADGVWQTRLDITLEES